MTPADLELLRTGKVAEMRPNRTGAYTVKAWASWTPGPPADRFETDDLREAILYASELEYPLVDVISHRPDNLVVAMRRLLPFDWRGIPIDTIAELLAAFKATGEIRDRDGR